MKSLQSRWDDLRNRIKSLKIQLCLMLLTCSRWSAKRGKTSSLQSQGARDRFNKFDITFFLFLYTSHTYIMSLLEPIHYTRGANIHLNKNNFFIAIRTDFGQICRLFESYQFVHFKSDQIFVAISDVERSINFISRWRRSNRAHDRQSFLFRDVKVSKIRGKLRRYFRKNFFFKKNVHTREKLLQEKNWEN